MEVLDRNYKKEMKYKFNNIKMIVSDTNLNIPVTELQIPVPWGHIAAKVWGNEKDEAILAVHGFNDNAASFDQLIPLIMPGFYIVCIDLPGHGLSSNYPHGVDLTYISYVCDLKYVFNYFAWSKCIILCHSIGSHICLYFSSIFTESVIKLIILDIFIGLLIPEMHFVSDRCLGYIEKFISLENSLSKPSFYTYDEALHKFLVKRYFYLSDKPAQALLKRCLTENKSGFIIKNDKKLQFLKYPLITKDFHFGLVRSIKCPVFIIVSSSFEEFLHLPDINNTLDILKLTLRNRFELVKIAGNHYAHLNQPKTVADIINKFLLHTFSQL